MPITLITGSTGSGKTLFTVQKMLPDLQSRPVICHGIPGLKGVVPIPPIDHWTTLRTDPNISDKKLATRPEFIFPASSMVIIDEAQTIFRPRPPSSAPPDYVKALETHRHTGIDFILITQHPSRIDVHVRQLVARHIHIRRVGSTNNCVTYEWDEASDPSRRANAVKGFFRYSPKVFEQYQSSVYHTNRKVTLPLPAILVLLSIPLIGYAAIRTKNSLDEKTKPAATLPGTIQPAATSPGTIQPGLTSPGTIQPGSTTPGAVKPPDLIIRDPFHDVAACVSFKGKCQCYDSAAYKIETSKTICESYVSRQRL